MDPVTAGTLEDRLLAEWRAFLVEGAAACRVVAAEVAAGGGFSPATAARVKKLTRHGKGMLGVLDELVDARTRLGDGPAGIK